MWKARLEKLRNPGIERDLRPYRAQLQAIRQQEKSLADLSEAALQTQAQQLRLQARQGQPLAELLVPVYALVCETAWRQLGMRPFDEQVLAGICLHQGKVVEMQTGEGKTLAATLPVVLHALTGQGVHVHTFNDYLARRDAEWMGPIYRFHGLSLGVIQSNQVSPPARKTGYQADITYLTAKEGGFDYLRSQLINNPADQVQRIGAMALIDEVDSLLIDEARVPLVIAGARPEGAPRLRGQIAQLVAQFRPQVDFQTDHYELNIYLTETGIARVEAALDCENIFAVGQEHTLIQVNQALQAQHLLHRDVDYLVQDDRIKLVDEFTGRVVENRKWPHGLQAAIEAKEGLPIQPSGQILGKATLPDFFACYPRRCGMTGTAQAAAEEFWQAYGMPVAIIPPHKPNQRQDLPDEIYATEARKRAAVVAEIQRAHGKGQPVLVGTASVQASESLAQDLQAVGLPCQVLNAKADDAEAALIAEAGRLGAITISTNMAGRGTDIKLGGEQGEEETAVRALGGLYVIGTQRFESARIDQQLRGRAGRQGDPGQSRFFLSLEDPLLQKHGIYKLVPKRFRQPDQSGPLSHRVIRREVDRVQRIIAGKNLSIRSTLWRYASFINQQQRIVQRRRQAYVMREFESAWQAADPDIYHKHVQAWGPDLVREAEAQVSMAVLDQAWSDYLEEVDQIRQGIHLVALGGEAPFQSFQQRVDALFYTWWADWEQACLQKLQSLQLGPEGVDLAREGLKRPASTWTYLMNDNPFGDRLEMMLLSQGQIGFAAAAMLFWWPLLGLYFLLRKKRSPGGAKHR